MLKERLRKYQRFADITGTIIYHQKHKTEKKRDKEAKRLYCWLHFRQMILNPNIKDIFAFDYDDFTLEGYEPHALIKGSVAV